MPESSTTVLGKKVATPRSYRPDILQPIARQQRPPLSVAAVGFDAWTCWELYWLNHDRIPESGVLQFIVPAYSDYIIESKSLKLYLHGFNYQSLPSSQHLLETIQADLQQRLGCDIELRLSQGEIARHAPLGDNLSQLGVAHTQSNPQGNYWFDAFRSLCPVTGQPDFATVYVESVSIEPGWLLQRFMSLRDHCGFHEQCVDSLYASIAAQQTSPFKIGAAFLRRGGIDIHPVRYSRGFMQHQSAPLCFSTNRQ